MAKIHLLKIRTSIFILSTEKCNVFSSTLNYIKNLMACPRDFEHQIFAHGWGIKLCTHDQDLGMRKFCIYANFA